MSDKNIYETLPLTNREKKIIALVAQGLSNTEIADKLCISTNTVKDHLAHIYSKYYIADIEKSVMRVRAVLKYLELKSERQVTEDLSRQLCEMCKIKM